MSNHSRWIVLKTSDFGVLAPHGIIRPLPLLLLFAAAATPCATAQPSTEASSDYPSTNFNPSLAFVVVVLVCAFVFLGFFSIYIRLYADESAGERNSGQTAAVNFRQSSPGLDPAVIKSFPVFQYSEVKDVKIGTGALECAVCISEFEDDETLRLLPNCDHVFHPACIDAWLASHTTCPVCRANLVPIPDEISGDAAQGTESNDSENMQNLRSELGEVQNQNQNQNQNQISIDIDEHQNRDPHPQASEIPKRNRQRAARFQRSHSTGHSLIQSGENFKRYTLRLPEEAWKQIMSRTLNRTTSCVVFPTEGSSRRGYRNGGEGSIRGTQVGRSDLVGRSDRWVFTMTPPFFSRSRSVKSPK